MEVRGRKLQKVNFVNLKSLFLSCPDAAADTLSPGPGDSLYKCCE